MSTDHKSSLSSSVVLKLRSSDDEIFEVRKEVLLESITLRNIIEEDDYTDTDIIPIPNVEGTVLSKVIQYCQKHVEARATAIGSESEGAATKKFDSEFVDIDKNTLFDLILAANYLNIAGLMDLTCQTVANLIKDSSVEEVRKIFNIKNDFTPEEEEQIRNEYKWAFE